MKEENKRARKIDNKIDYKNKALIREYEKAINTQEKKFEFKAVSYNTRDFTLNFTKWLASK